MKANSARVGFSAPSLSLPDECEEIMIRTKNPSELKVIRDLEKEGYEVLKRGWPDFIAFKGSTVRFIEVKRLTTSRGKLSRSELKPDQIKVADILKQFGITVELVRGM